MSAYIRWADRTQKGRYFRWSPRTIAKLAEMAGSASVAEIARVLGATRPCVASKMKRLNLDHLLNLRRVKAYAEQYSVSRDAVYGVGVDRLDRMSDEARALMLRIWDREAGAHARVRQRKPVQAETVPCVTAEQLMAASERVSRAIAERVRRVA